MGGYVGQEMVGSVTHKVPEQYMKLAREDLGDPDSTATPPTIPEVGPTPNLSEATIIFLGALGRATKGFFIEGTTPPALDSKPASKQKDTRELTPTRAPGLALTPDGEVVDTYGERRHEDLKVAGGPMGVIDPKRRYDS